MANCWYYLIFTREAEAFSERNVELAIKAANSVGYFVQNNERSNQIWPLDGSGWLSTDYQSETITLLATEGGMIKFWKGADPDEAYIDLDVVFMPADNRSLGEVQIVVRDSLFRSDELRREVAEDVHKLFGDLCDLTNSSLGYCADETAIEKFFGEFAAVERCFGQSDAPSALGWLNYFSSKSFRDVEQHLLSLGPAIDKTSSGALVSFFDYPWCVDLKRLAEINKRWCIWLDEKR